MIESNSFDAGSFGKALAMSAFQNPILRTFFKEEIQLLETAGVPQLKYHQERVIFVGSAAAFAIRGYLGTSALADAVWNGYATLWRDYGASAPDRLSTFQLLERRLAGYVLAATEDLMRERSAAAAESPPQIVHIYLNAIREHAADHRTAETPLLTICQNYGLPVWKRQVASAGGAMKAAGLPVEEASPNGAA